MMLGLKRARARWAASNNDGRNSASERSHRHAASREASRATFSNPSAVVDGARSSCVGMVSGLFAPPTLAKIISETVTLCGTSGFIRNPCSILDYRLST